MKSIVWNKIYWGTPVKTNYTYDERWNNTSITDANSNQTFYTYDTLNRVITTTYPDGKTLNYTYDKSWNLITQLDPNWTQVTNTYDNLNRLTKRDINTWSWVIWVTSENYTYDDIWRLIGN